MKKYLSLIMLLVCFFTTIVYADAVVDYIIDKKANTISDGRYEYQFSVIGSGTSLEIIYPDGATYTEMETGNGGYTVSWSDDYIAFTKDNEKGYTPGDTLCNAYRRENPVREKKNIVICIVIFLFGIFSLLAPEYAWHLRYGWVFKKAEPSDTAIVAERITGGALIAFVVIYIIV